MAHSTKDHHIEQISFRFLFNGFQQFLKRDEVSHRRCWLQGRIQKRLKYSLNSKILSSGGTSCTTVNKGNIAVEVFRSHGFVGRNHTFFNDRFCPSLYRSANLNGSPSSSTITFASGKWKVKSFAADPVSNRRISLIHQGEKHISLNSAYSTVRAGSPSKIGFTSS